jgi:hypothetical protein
MRRRDSALPNLLAILICTIAAFAASAAPGAHGPNGEHLEGPASGAGRADAAPRMEAKSEAFEMVATLSGGELSILIDRFDTNEPVLDARVEVESGTLKAPAKYHADHGDYSVDDPGLLSALRQPGAHPVVVTLIAGEESDLLEGTLRVTTALSEDGQGHSHDADGSHGAAAAASHGRTGQLRTYGIAALVALGVAVGVWRWRRGRRIGPMELPK